VFGPSLIPNEYVQKLAETGTTLLGTSHRKPAVKELVKEVQEGIKKYFNLPEGYEVLLGNGGATFLFDAIGLGMVEKSSVHFTCGEFSTKWFKSHNKIPWIEAENISVEFGHGINPKNVEGHDMICMTLNETSTGVMIGNLDELSKTDALVAIDATSGAGQIPVDFNKVDLYFFSPQKVFASEGGTFVAIASPRAIERARKINQDTSRYIPEIMNWELCIDNSLKNQTYNTPNVSGLFYLNEQLKAMNALGEAKVVEMARAKAKHVYEWAESKDYLNPYVEEAQFRSIAVATINVDEKLPVDTLLATLRKQNIVYDIDAYRKLGKNQFRISLFHNVTLENLQKLTSILSLALES
jgi:phosphoserine aminotransferase